MLLPTKLLLAAIIASPIAFATCQASTQQEEIEGLKQDVADLKQEVAQLREVDRKVQSVLDLQIKLNGVQTEINALVKGKLLTKP